MADVELKIILLGDSAVGKTSLLMRYTQNKFSDNHISTLGVEYETKQIRMNNKNVLLHFMDTSGQDKYRALTKNMFNDIDGVVFVFDVTIKESFDNIKDWLKDVESYCPDFSCVLVGNKIDLQNSKCVNEEDIKNIDCLKDKEYFEASAKDNINVDKPFEKLTDIILMKLVRTGSISNYERSRTQSFNLENPSNKAKPDKSCSCCCS